MKLKSPTIKTWSSHPPLAAWGGTSAKVQHAMPNGTTHSKGAQRELGFAHHEAPFSLSTSASVQMAFAHPKAEPPADLVCTFLVAPGTACPYSRDSTAYPWRS